MSFKKAKSHISFKALCCKSILLILFVPIFSFSKTDSLLNVLKTAKDTAKINTLIRLADEYMFSGNMEEAEKCIITAQNENSIVKSRSSGLLIALKNISFYYKKSAFRLSFELCEETLPVAIELKDQTKIAECKSYMGMNAGRLGNFKRALELYHEALPVFESTNNYYWQTKLYSSIAGVYFDQFDYNMAIEYFSKTLDIAIKKSDKKVIGQTYNNIGSAWQNLGKQQKAKEFYLKAVEINSEANNLGNLAYNYMNLASCELSEGDIDLAKAYNKKALDIFVKFKDTYSIVGCMCVEADICNEKKEYKKAVEILKEATVLCEKTGSPLLMERTYKQMAAAFEMAGDYKNSVMYYKKFITTKDSIINEEIREELTKKQLYYEFDKKRLADSLETMTKEKYLQQEIESNKRSASLQRKISTISLISLLIVAALGFFIYRGSVKNKHAKKLIEKQKLIVELKNKAILDSMYYAKRIQQSLLPSEKYMKRNLEELKKKDKNTTS